MWPSDSTGRYEIVSETDRRGRPLRTVIDMDTGLVRHDPIPGDAELARFYSRDYRVRYKGAYRPRRRQVLRNFRRAAAHIRTHRELLEPTRRVLEIGAGSGEFAFLMTRLGKTVMGIEPNVEYATYCRDELGLDVRTRHLAHDLFQPGQFDLIRMNHVLEHLNNPTKYLSEIASWLTPDGLLWVAVPNIETYCRSKSRGRMFHYAHVFNFNPCTLRVCAGLAGLAEAPETASWSAGTTSAYFRKDPKIAGSTKIENPQNAQQVRAMIRAHYDGAFSKGKAARPMRKLVTRIEETLTGLALGPPTSIGESVARRLQ